MWSNRMTSVKGPVTRAVSHCYFWFVARVLFLQEEVEDMMAMQAAHATSMLKITSVLRSMATAASPTSVRHNVQSRNDGEDFSGG